jgi:hypothetical protein
MGFKVELSHHSSPTPISMKYITQSGSAGSDDYAMATGTLNFAQNEVEKMIFVFPKVDSIAESNETFTVLLYGLTGPATFSDSKATGTILDDDPSKFHVNDAGASEGNGPVKFTVTRCGEATTSAAVNYSTQGVTAIAWQDYLPASGLLSFAPNERTKTVLVNLIDDSEYQEASPETFNLNLYGQSGAALGDKVGIGSVFNNDYIS